MGNGQYHPMSHGSNCRGGDLGVVYGNPIGFVQGDSQAISTVYQNFLYVEGDILRMIDENVIRFLDSDVIGIFDENID